jgi:hypothetical protein
VSANLRLPPERPLPAVRMSERKEHLVNEIMRMERGERPGGVARRRRWAGLVLVPAAVVALAAGAYAIVMPDPMDVVDGIGCARTAERESDLTVVAADGRDPVEVCAELWEQGVVATGVHREPPLVACTSADSAGVWVFPGDEGTCGELGMGPLPPDYERAASRYGPMREELYRRLYATLDDDDCFPPEQARALVREVLDEHGFTRWTIEDDGMEPCVATVALDPPRRTATLILGTDNPE